MNFRKHRFTKEEFLDLPVYGTKQEANTGEFFLLGEYFDGKVNRMSRYGYQKEILMDYIEMMGKMNEQEKAKIREEEFFKVVFLKKHKDGNISELGGHIDIEEILDSLIIINTDEGVIQVEG